MDLLLLLFFPSGSGPAEETMRILRPMGPASNEDTERAELPCTPAWDGGGGELDPEAFG
jgi:hypothetical protein